MSETTVAFIPVDKIRINKESLRDVDVKNPQFQELMNSVKVEGILNPINVAPGEDPETKELYYGLVDGLQRLTAAKAAGMTEVPALIKDATQVEVWRRQVIGNAVRVDTRPVEFAKQLQRLMGADPMCTVASMAAQVNKSDAWVKERLNLTNLIPEAAALVDEGVINITSAFSLAKLPADVQPEFLEKAQTLPHTDFAPLCVTRKKEIDKAKREGRVATGSDFTPTPHLQKLGDIKSEIETGSMGAKLIANGRVTSPEEAFKLALQWALHIDPMSAADQRMKHEEIQKTAKEKKEKAELERAKKKLEASNLEAERADLVLKTMESGGDVDAALKEFDEKHKKTETPTA